MLELCHSFYVNYKCNEFNYLGTKWIVDRNYQRNERIKWSENRIYEILWLLNFENDLKTKWILTSNEDADAKIVGNAVVMQYSQSVAEEQKWGREKKRDVEQTTPPSANVLRSPESRCSPGIPGFCVAWLTVECLLINVIFIKINFNMFCFNMNFS